MINIKPDSTAQEANNLPQEQNDILEKSKKLSKATPNWRKRLRKTVIATALPLMSIISGIGTQVGDIPKATGVSDDHGDIPEIVYSTESVPSYIYSMARDAFSYTMPVEAGQNIEDIFVFELGKQLAPELQLVNIQSLKDANKLEEVMVTIGRYSAENNDFYKDLRDRYFRSLRTFNKGKQIDESGKFLETSEIKALQINALMAELRLNQMLGGVINNDS